MIAWYRLSCLHDFYCLDSTSCSERKIDCIFNINFKVTATKKSGKEQKSEHYQKQYMLSIIKNDHKISFQSSKLAAKRLKQSQNQQIILNLQRWKKWRTRKERTKTRQDRTKPSSEREQDRSFDVKPKTTIIHRWVLGKMNKEMTVKRILVENKATLVFKIEITSIVDTNISRTQTASFWTSILKERIRNLVSSWHYAQIRLKRNWHMMYLKRNQLTMLWQTCMGERIYKSIMYLKSPSE